MQITKEEIKITSFIDDAIKHGASAIVVSREGITGKSVPIIKVPDTNRELPYLCQKFYDYPDQKLKMIGVTGTDGKTTTASIIRDLLGHDLCGYIGTNGVEGKTFSDKLTNTTPECHLIYKYLYLFNKDNLKYVSMETSSEAFYRDRLSSFTFDVGILTNITEDHLNIHKTMDNYIDSKKNLFRQIKSDGVAILNMDDKYFDEFKYIHNNTLTYGKNPLADLYIKDVMENINNTDITFVYENKIYKVCSPLLGMFNVYNLMAGILCLLSFDIEMDEILSRVKNINTPKGRCEFLDFNTDYKIVLDYAHTPKGLEAILDYLNKIKKRRIITVTGSAGSREKEKRDEMGRVVLEKSDIVIFTMDDPRDEDPNEIIKEMINNREGCYQIIIDRADAINFALAHAMCGDIVLIAGKGRDSYMAIGDEYIPYSDYEVIKEYFS